jgi:IS5 family transposase
MFRTIGDRPSAWELLLPPEVLRLPEELARVDAVLDDPVFFAPFAPFFHPVLGRPSTPAECYLRLMFLKFRYRLGFESLCAEVADSISWRRFCRIPLDGKVPHPTTLMKLTTRCGSAAVDGLNEALLAKAAEAKLLRTSRLRADTTVVPANVAYPTDSGLLAKAVRRIAAAGRRIQAAGGATRTRVRDRSRSAGSRAHGIAARLGRRGAQGREEAQAGVRRITGELAGLAERAAADAGRLLVNARCALRRAKIRAAELAAAGVLDPVAGRRRGRRSMTWPACWRLPGGSLRRPGSGWPGSPRTGRPGGSACTTRTPGRSPRAASANRPGSATRPRSPATTTASSWITISSRAILPTPRSSRQLSSGSSTAPGAVPGPSPPTAATARRASTMTCTPWASALS